MWTNLLFLCLTLRWIICTAVDHTSFRVTQAPEQASVSRGGNITFYCIFPISQDHSWLLSATFQDSGIYHCAVMRQGIVRGNGTGSHLIVHAAPTPLTIVSLTAEVNSSAPQILMCETAEFYPENFTLTWYKNGVETAIGIHTVKRQNIEGLYEVSSTLEETQPVSSGAKYTCSVSHVSLETPAVITYTKSNPASVIDVSLYFWAPACAVGGLAFLVLMVFIGRRCRLQNNEGKQGRAVGPTRGEELGAEAEILHYTALDLTRDRKTPGGKREEKIVYAQIKQRATRDKLTYATLALTGSEKTGKCKNNERSTEYAQLQTKKQRVTEAAYSEARTK
ncbi:uncharacterized protein [Heptranchias perlo]|uniref:uncharacterized protein isoform X3 n=1 Tax=Heptranchias perlo TaxID=212740 RepID=UPI00355A1234